MKTVLVDSNVLLDIATNDKTWFEWSSQALESAANEALLAINAIIYGEVSIGFSRIEDLELALHSPRSGVTRFPTKLLFSRAKRSFNIGGVVEPA
jgi:hypothetical protein